MLDSKEIWLVLGLAACSSGPKNTSGPDTDTDTGTDTDTDTGTDTGTDTDTDTGTDTGTAPVDLDGDGFAEDVDCDDTDPAVHPGAAELCNGRDDDCDGVVDPFLRVPEDHATIQVAIDAASAGDVVCVSAGTYVELLEFGGKDVSVIGAGGAEATVIDGGGVGPVVTFRSGETAAAVLQGFTVTGGVVYWTEGGGVLVEDTSPTLLNLEITGNSCVDYYNCIAAGLKITQGSPYVAGVVVSDNICTPTRGPTYGCGIFAHGGAPIFERVIVAGNAASGGWAAPTAEGVGIMMFEADAVLNNVIIADNTSTAYHSEGVGLSLLYGAPALTNVAIIGNRVEGGVTALGTGVKTDDYTAATFTNVSITGNDADVSEWVYGAGLAN